MDSRYAVDSLCGNFDFGPSAGRRDRCETDSAGRPRPVRLMTPWYADAKYRMNSSRRRHSRGAPNRRGVAPVRPRPPPPWQRGRCCDGLTRGLPVPRRRGKKIAVTAVTRERTKNVRRRRYKRRGRSCAPGTHAVLDERNGITFPSTTTTSRPLSTI